LLLCVVVDQPPVQAEQEPEAKQYGRKRVRKDRSKTMERKLPGLLSAASVQVARELRRRGFTYAQIGEKFGVTASGAWQAIVGLTWIHVPDPITPRRRPRITAAEVTKIAELYKQGFGKSLIARKMRRSRGAIQSIVRSLCDARSPDDSPGPKSPRGKRGQRPILNAKKVRVAREMRLDALRNRKTPRSLRARLLAARSALYAYQRQSLP
jgi:hypothetical protein